MRRKKNFKTIKVENSVYKRVLDDREKFQNLIGGGKWSVSDTIAEYVKVIDGMEVK